MSKIRVAVLQGGQSGEHEVSMVSASNVMQYLDRERFSVTPVIIFRDGSVQVGEEPERTTAGRFFERKREFDVVFPVVHGTLCEDGSLQGLLEQAGLPYVGCGVLASAIGMDKVMSKRLAREAGIPVAPFVVVRKVAFERSPEKDIAEIAAKLSFPVFVKPANAGSSVGIDKVTSAAGLKDAIRVAFQYDHKVLVEEGIDAIELEVAVLEAPNGGTPITSVVGEIRPHHAFYSYAAKYLDDKGADLLVPAEIDTDTEQRARELAKAIFQTFECEGMARVDLFLERNSGRILLNELNTIPGFTAISMYPRLMAATGISYAELLSRLVDLALSRHTRQQQLVRDFPEGQRLLNKQVKHATPA